MTDNLFDTKDKRNLAVLNMKNLIVSPGWQLIVAILDANIEVVRNQILEGVDNETKETIEILRDKLRAYQNLRNTPEMIIKQLTEDSAITPNLDPYATMSEFLQERKNKN